MLAPVTWEGLGQQLFIPGHLIPHPGSTVHMFQGFWRGFQGTETPPLWLSREVAGEIVTAVGFTPAQAPVSPSASAPTVCLIGPRNWLRTRETLTAPWKHIEA